MATLNIKGFPKELYIVLGEQAKKNRRSLSAEVIYLLEHAIETVNKRKNSILRIKGLGKEKWKNVDVIKHIKNERDSWE